MKRKIYKEKYSKKASKKKAEHRQLVDLKWIFTITITAFLISLVFSFVSETLIPNINIFFSIILVLIVILIGVVFDMVGISTTSADVKTFHSMAAKKVRGASLAVYFIKHADKVSSFCNDVVGDICGIISGSAGAAISIIIASKLKIDALLITLPVTALIASLTIGGKAMGKAYAVNKGTLIMYEFSKFMSYFVKNK